ncbi:MAG: cytochrome c maturation protein CcmE [Bacteroidetes bacterium]|nr:MAG: cytochrome c maturation protein CcmE [Bacteroidota bacterium]
MRPKTIIGIVLLVAFSSLLLMNFGSQVGGYMNFVQAEESGSRAHVIGDWVRDQSFKYDATTNIFSFHMVDEMGNVRQVRYMNPKPPNFEDAERLVVDGYPKGEIFIAEHILVKCPSKYENPDEFNDVPDLTKS